MLLCIYMHILDIDPLDSMVAVGAAFCHEITSDYTERRIVVRTGGMAIFIAPGHRCVVEISTTTGTGECKNTPAR